MPIVKRCECNNYMCEAASHGEDREEWCQETEGIAEGLCAECYEHKDA